MEIFSNIKTAKKQIYQSVYQALMYTELYKEEDLITINGHLFADKIADFAVAEFAEEWKKAKEVVSEPSGKDQQEFFNQ